MNDAEPDRPADDHVPAGLLRSMQIIAGALIAGVSIFLVIALYQVYQQTGGQFTAPSDRLPIITLLALGMFAVCAVLSFLVPSITASRMLRELVAKNQANAPGAQSKNVDGLLQIRQATMIIGLALLEGSAFFNCIAYLLEMSGLALGAVLAALFLMIVRFPTEGRVRNWIEEKARRLAEMS